MKNTKFHTPYPWAAEFMRYESTDYCVGLPLHDCAMHVACGKPVLQHWNRDCNVSQLENARPTLDHSIVVAAISKWCPISLLLSGIMVDILSTFCEELLV